MARHSLVYGGLSLPATTRPLSIILLLIFITTNLAPIYSSSPSLAVSRGILYVGGNGPGNYTSIQAAVDNASDGDTVYVYPGIYDEHVLITTPLTLCGEAASTAIIDGGGSGNDIKITAQDVTITNLTLQHGGIGV